MAQKFDGVIEAARYTPTGQIEVVRVYERRGPTFSDHVLWTRTELLDQLKAGRKVFTGARILLMASTFDLAKPVRLLRGPRGEVVTTAAAAGEHDVLEGAPLF